MPDLDPTRIIFAVFFDHFLTNTRDIPRIIDRTGMQVNWSISEEEDYSYSTRLSAYRSRIMLTFNDLDDEQKLTVVSIITSKLVERDLAEELDMSLRAIGWSLDDNRLIPGSFEVIEQFFPGSSQHDAYKEIRGIIQSATSSILIVDPYVDATFFDLIATNQESLKIKLLSYTLAGDFLIEAKKFLAQYSQYELEIRKTRDFHDRFIISDDDCWHIGCSIKDAGKKAFMISKMEDERNKDLLVTQINDSWSSATPEPL